MDKPRLTLFIAGLLVLGMAGTCALYYSKYKAVEAERAQDATRIGELESQLALAEHEISDYRDKLRDANAIAEELEGERDAKQRLALEYAAKVEELEATIEHRSEPEPPAMPAVETASATIIPAVEATNEAATEPAVEPAGETATEPVVVARADAEAPRAEDPGAPEDAGPEDAGPVLIEPEPPGPKGTGPVEAGTRRDEPPVTPKTTPAAEGRGNLEREIEEVRAEKRDLEIKYAALVGDKAGGVPLGKVKVATGLRLKSKVLVVNRNHNFVVVDAGARDGVEKGMVLVLHRAKKYVGKCQVEKVYDRMAAADLMLDWMREEVQVNDGARKF